MTEAQKVWETPAVTQVVYLHGEDRPVRVDDLKPTDDPTVVVNVGEFTKEHFELLLGIKLEDWQVRLIEGYKRGDILQVPQTPVEGS